MTNPPSNIRSVQVKDTRSSEQGAASHRAEQLAKPGAGRELTFTNLEELEDLAKPPLLPHAVFGYYKSGAESEASVRFNREAYARFRLLPRVLVDVSQLDTSTTLLGKKLSFPVLIAPMAMQRMAHDDGELAVAKAAAAAGIPMVQSTMGTVRLDKVAAAGEGAPFMMFQLYVIKEREYTQRLIQDAEKAGYSALVVTVDAPQLGNREADVRNSFKLPAHLQLENLVALGRRDAEIRGDQPGSGIAATFASHIDPSLTWDFIAWMHSVTRLLIFVKGILSPQDAQRAIDAGVDGIIVSNHGGRQVDFAPAPLDMLAAVASVVNGRVPLLVDGGIRRGTDIIKALAMGADAVLIGRPVMYGLALGGQAGVARVLGILKNEFSLSMQLMGCPTVQDLNRGRLIAPWEHPSKL